MTGRPVLKVPTRRKAAEGRWAASDDPRHWNCWRRETHVHEAGLAQTWQPYGIRAPRLPARVERPDGEVALWLSETVRAAATTGTCRPAETLVKGLSPSSRQTR
ncbi:hypothetical protein [Streptomyces phaeoluteigriseus]